MKRIWFASLGLTCGWLLLGGAWHPGHGQDKQGAVEAERLPDRALRRFGTAKFRHGDRVMALAYSPTGRILAAGGGNDPVRLWDTDTGVEIRQVKENWVHAIAFTPRGSVFATAGAFKIIKLFETATGKEVNKMEGHGTAVRAMVISPDGSMLASGGADGAVILWELLTSKIITTFKGHTDEINGLAFSADSSFLASASSDRTIRIWDADQGKFVKQLEGGCSVQAVAFSLDGKTLYSGGDDHRIRIWDLASGKQTGDKQTHKGSVVSLTMSRDGKTLYSGGQDGTLQVWETGGTKEARILHRHSGDSDALALSKDGKFLATAGINNTIRIFDAAAGKEITPGGGHLAGIAGMALADDNATVASISADGQVRLWDAKSAKDLGTWNCKHTGPELVFALAPGDKVVATASGHDPIRFWDAAGGLKLELPTQPGDGVLSLRFAPDGKTLAVGRRSGAVELFDWAAKKSLQNLKCPGSVYAVAFSRDGQKMAASGSGRIVVWETATGKEIKSFNCKEGPAPTLPAIASLAFGADKTLAAGCFDGIIRIFDFTSGKEVRVCEPNPLSVAYGLAFSSDGRMLASGLFDKTVRLWEPFSGLQIAALQGHQGPVTSVAFARDGRTLLSASTDTTLMAWDGTGQMKGGQLATLVLDAQVLVSGWTTLASEDAKRGHDMLWQMVASPKETLTFLGTPGQLQLVDPQRIDQLFRDLNSDMFKVRDKATKELERYGEWMRGRLQKAAEKPPTLEVEDRLRRMLEKLNSKGSLSLAQERIRLRRTMMILEQIADERAVALLQSLAKGAPEVDLQQEAEDSLRRMGKATAIKTGS